MPKPKPIFKRKNRSTKAKFWKCSSLLHRQSAEIIERLLHADEHKQYGVNLKSLTLAKEVQSKKATHAVVCETLRYLPVIKELLKQTGLERKLDNRIGRGGIYVLVYDMLFGQSLSAAGPAEMKKELKAALQSYLSIKHVQDVSELIPKHGNCRRVFARVNALKTTIDEVCQILKNHDLKVVEWVPDVLEFAPGTQLYNHPLVKTGGLLLQGLGSSFVAHALKAKQEWIVLDACAAPGNKTTHLAALLKHPGRIIALDLNRARFKRLKETISLSGASNIIAKQIDFLTTNPNSNEYSSVEGIILDPSCSGSGTVLSRMDELLPSTYHQKQGTVSKDTERIQRLSTLQVKMLTHGLSFPNLKRLVYSTCSVHEEENEQVIQTVMETAKSNGFMLEGVLPSWPRRGHPLFAGCEKMIRIDPFVDQTDGFFIAVFVRTTK